MSLRSTKKSELGLGVRALGPSGLSSWILPSKVFCQKAFGFCQANNIASSLVIEQSVLLVPKCTINCVNNNEFTTNLLRGSVVNVGFGNDCIFQILRAKVFLAGREMQEAFQQSGTTWVPKSCLMLRVDFHMLIIYILAGCKLM